MNKMKKYTYEEEDDNELPNDPVDFPLDDNHAKAKSSQTFESKDEYIELLQNKVRTQADRLYSLQNYKILCEKMLKQLNPSMQLPIQEEDLNKADFYISGDVKNKHLLDSLKNQVNILTRDLNEANNLINEYSNKYESLQSKYNNLLKESVPKSYLSFSFQDAPNRSNSSLFPSVEKIPIERLKDAYSEIQNNYKALLNEKEILLESLRNQTIENEEQKNYIEILKEALESSIIKNGLTNFLNSQKTKFFKNTNKSNIDIMIDIAHLSEECEKAAKEIENLTQKNEELNIETNALRKLNNDMNDKKEKIMNSLENGIKELEEAKNRLSQIENDKLSLMKENKELKENIEKIYEDNKNLKNTIDDYEKVLQDCDEKIVMLGNELENKKILEKKVVEYKDSYNTLNNDFESLNSEKKEMEDTIRNFEEKIEKIKNENSDLIKNNKELKINLNKINEENENKQRVIEDLKKNEEKMKNLQNLYEETKSEIDSLKRKLIDSDDLIEKLNAQLDQNNYKIKILEEEKSRLIENNIKLKNDNQTLLIENKNFKNNNDSLSENYSLLNKDYERLNKAYKSLDQSFNILQLEKDKASMDLKTMRDRFEKEIFYKTNNLNQISNDLELKNSEILRMNDKINYLEKEIQNKNFENRKIEETLKQKEEMLTLEKEELKMKTIDSNKIYNKLQDLEKEKENVIMDYKVLSEKYEKIKKEKNILEENLENTRKYQNKKQQTNQGVISNKNPSNEDLKKINLQNTFHELKLAINSCLSVSNVFINKFKALSLDRSQHSNNNDLSFSQGFLENLNDHGNKMAKLSLNDNNLINSLRKIEDWINVVCSELEACYQKIQESNSLLKSHNDRRDDSVLFNKKIESDYLELKKEYSNLREEYNYLQKKYDSTVQQMRSYKNDNRKLLAKLNSGSFNNNNNSVKGNENNNCSNTETFEDKVILLTKEKKYLESLILKLLRKIDNDEDFETFTELMKLNEDLIKLESEKAKIERKLKKCENKEEYSKLSEICHEINRSIKEVREGIDEINRTSVHIKGKHTEPIIKKENDYEYSLRQPKSSNYNTSENIFKQNYNKTNEKQIKKSPSINKLEMTNYDYFDNDTVTKKYPQPSSSYYNRVNISDDI